MKRAAMIALVVLTGAAYAPPAFSHCEIPCGIYDDSMRLDMIAEDIATIEKSMRKIVELSAQKEKNYNQIVRWVVNKDTHAEKIQEIVARYFMAQRIKPVGPDNPKARADYVRKLSMLHKMLVYTMKAKQGTDTAVTVKLRSLLAQFRTAYLGGGKGREGQ